MHQSSSFKLTVPQLVKKFLTLQRTRRFITTFTRAHHLSLSRTRSIKSMPSYSSSLRSILISSSHQHLSLPSGLFPSSFATIKLHAFSSSSLHVTHPTHFKYFIWWLDIHIKQWANDYTIYIWNVKIILGKTVHLLSNIQECKRSRPVYT